MKPNARKLILGLWLATDGAPLNVRDAINACSLFDITENNVRVTLVRRKGDRFEVSYPWDVNAARLQHFEEPSTFQF